MSARDELADIIKREYRSAVTRKSDDCYTAPADAILDAGYRKPRTITTAEELGDVALLTVIRSASGVVSEWYAGYWQETGTRDVLTSNDIDLPATVLYEPTA